VHDHHYRHLLIMAGVSFVAMYVLMYAMVDAFGSVYVNVNQFYMAALMTGPMLAIELLVMRSMYKNRRFNVALFAASAAVGVLCFLLIRQQGGVSDRQFLRSMIPHHAGAILMCEEARLSDPEIQTLCGTIIASQRAEIDQMRAKLRHLE
jgi:uncharacterized protein (DUF305 family)